MRPDNKKVSIRAFLFVAFAGFSVVILLLLWLFQIFFLPSFYDGIMQLRAARAADELLAASTEENFAERIEGVAERGQFCVKVYAVSGEAPVQIHSVHMGGACCLYRLDAESIYQVYEKAEKGGGDYHERLKDGEATRLLTVHTSQNQNGEKMMVLLDNAVEPVRATTEILRIELGAISVFMFLFSVVLSFLISDYISQPIEKVNKQAKMLAEAKYEAEDSVVNYREIVELSDTLAHAADELAKVEKMQKELVANISHDLRTPLTMIIGYGEVMRDIKEENTPENMQVLIDEALRLSSLVDDLLELSKIQAGTRVAQKEVFNFTEEIEGTVKRYQNLREHEGFVFSLDADGDVYVNADRGMIGQVVCNLLNNAVHYSGDSREIAVRCKVADGFVTFEVRDFGIGIAEEELPHIWERYYRASQNHRRTVRGSGLGLSIVREILELHGARYGVGSRLGEGTLFWFSLPTVPTEENQ
ncbi:MAG: HAMP domain-containing histidine kinase [Clostridia bacterium]|nr:HAMP domain-containing histidine kinase [Clostridia bacterium]